MTDPIALLQDAVARAAAASTDDPTAAALATADAAGRPSVRVVLVKRIDGGGLVFFTNLESRKGAELAANPQAALCFHWPALAEQVRAEGPVAPVPAAEADDYFATRPRISQLGAWASRQSRPIATRDELEEAVAEVEARFRNRPVPRPPYWGGYRLVPERIEHWKGELGRLHRRTLFTRAPDGSWSATLLAP